MNIKYALALALAGGSLVTSSAFAMQVNSINELPKEGPVTIQGIVASVDDEKNFTLQDSAGKTIDVEATQPLSVTKGDQVSVNGKVESSALGMESEIASATVTKLGAANGSPTGGGQGRNESPSQSY